MKGRHRSCSPPCAPAHGAAEELAAQIDDCGSVLPCIDTEDAVRSIEPLSPRARTVKARISWLLPPSEGTRGNTRSVQVRFSYSEAFVCCDGHGGERVYESLMALLVANGCRASEGAR